MDYWELLDALGSRARIGIKSTQDEDGNDVDECEIADAFAEKYGEELIRVVGFDNAHIEKLEVPAWQEARNLANQMLNLGDRHA